MGDAAISNAAEYEKDHSDLRILEQRIAEREHPDDDKAFTKAGVRESKKGTQLFSVQA